MALIDNIIDWDNDLSTPQNYKTFSSIFEIINYRERNFFKSFYPTSGTDYAGFWDRLEAWLGNLGSDDDRKALFEFVLNIHYITSEDMISLFLSSISGPIKRWLIDLRNIEFNSNLDQNLNNQLKNKTWFVSMTDMDLGTFYRVNHIEGINVRPDFNFIVQLGDDKKIAQFIKKNRFEQIVSIEDFIGSGDQFIKILKKIPNFFKKIPILFTPQIICANGLDCIKKYLGCYPNWQIEPMLVVNDNDCLHPNMDLPESIFFQKILEIAKKFALDIVEAKNKEEEDEHIYGFNKTGSVLVLYTNTPDNTMPFIWWNYSDKWCPLFPRSSRGA